jgi:CubicO group peptidase (beta-lactamase class C family)
MEAHLKQLHPLLSELFELNGSPGLSLGVLHDDHPIYTAHLGQRRASTPDPPNDDTLYNVASLTKLMNAGVVFNFIEQGIVDWDVTICLYLPEFGERRDAGQHATLADLLASRTGLSAQHTYWGTMCEDIPVPRNQVPGMAVHVPAMGEFQKTFVYPSWGYVLVTLVIKRATKQPFSACAEKYMFRPLSISVRIGIFVHIMSGTAYCLGV